MNTKIIYTHSNEVMRCRWSEVGRGQVRKRKKLKGVKISQRISNTHEGRISK